MSGSLFRVAVLGFAALTACTGSHTVGKENDVDAGDARCNIENCRAVSDCRVAFLGEPDSRACFRAGLSPDAGFDFLAYCPAACNAQQGGALAQCATDSAMCITWDAGTILPQVLINECTSRGISGPGGPAVEPACESACFAAREKCESACPTTDFKTCIECAAVCGLEVVRCVDACPAG